jgi:hypothetical protein
MNLSTACRWISVIWAYDNDVEGSPYFRDAMYTKLYANLACYELVRNFES